MVTYIFATLHDTCSVKHDMQGLNHQVNKAGFKLECSHYKPDESAVAGEKSLPIVVYCHCNSGSRRDAEEALRVLMPLGIHVVTLDFAVYVQLSNLIW